MTNNRAGAASAAIYVRQVISHLRGQDGADTHGNIYDTWATGGGNYFTGLREAGLPEPGGGGLLQQPRREQRRQGPGEGYLIRGAIGEGPVVRTARWRVIERARQEVLVV